MAVREGKVLRDYKVGQVFPSVKGLPFMIRKPTGEVLLPTLCWCQKNTVVVSQDDVFAGRTMPCHRKDCKE